MDFIIGMVGDYFDIDCFRFGYLVVVVGFSNVLFLFYDFLLNLEFLFSEFFKVGIV